MNQSLKYFRNFIFVMILVFFSSCSSYGNISQLEQPNTRLGKMLFGKVDSLANKDIVFTLKKVYPLVWTSQNLQNDTRYRALVKMKNDEIFNIPFRLKRLDHSSIKHFKFFVPSDKEIQSIDIKDTQSLNLYKLKLQ